MSAAAVLERDPIYETDFIKEMIRQMRALDSYGTYDGQPGEKLLDPLIMTKERKAQILIVGDPDEETIACVKAFYNAIAVLIENECGQMAVPMVHLSHEGFGRALITVGKLVVSDRTLRDVLRKPAEDEDRRRQDPRGRPGNHRRASGRGGDVAMSEDELRELEKEVKKLKRIASEWAGQMHDLVEERLPAAYEEIPGLAQSTFDACQAWADANARLAKLNSMQPS